LTSSSKYDAFLALVRLGIGHPIYGMPEVNNWREIEALANQHGLSAVVLDGVEKLPESKRPPKELTLQWIGEVLQNYEQRYERYCKAIAEMAEFYNTHHYRMMILKGYACSLNWPNPKHRPCGDIDIWLFGQQKLADISLQESKEIKVDYTQPHHTVFYWGDFMVENHFDFLNVHHHKSNAGLEAILKELGRDDNYYSQLGGEWVWLPSPNLHALFLLRHTIGHFAAEHVSLRQILDWAFFVNAHSQKIDWPWLEKVLEEYGMIPIYRLLNAICVEDLGFDSSIFPSFQFDYRLKERVLNEVIEPEFGFGLPKSLFKRIIFKIRRWQGSAWKHELCYKESMLSAFCSGVKSHLLKPSSI
jgi:hypothetical protein